MFHLQRFPGGRGSTSPVMELRIYADGRAEYIGTAHVERLGTFYRRLTAAELADLNARFDNNGFWGLRDVYQGDIQDVGGTYVTYTKNGRSKQILDRQNAPPALRQIEMAMDQLVSSGEWKPNTSPPETTPSPTNERRSTKPQRINR